MSKVSHVCSQIANERLIWVVAKDRQPYIIKRTEGNAEKRVIPVFTSNDAYKAFQKKLGVDHELKEHCGEVAINFDVNQFDEIQVDPSPDFSTNLGTISNSEVLLNITHSHFNNHQWNLFNLQRLSLSSRMLLNDNQVNEPYLWQTVFMTLHSKVYPGTFYISGTGKFNVCTNRLFFAGDSRMFLRVYISDVHRDATIYSQKNEFESVPMSFHTMIKNWGGLPKSIIGISLDRLPEEWEIFAGRDCQNDKLDIAFQNPNK